MAVLSNLIKELRSRLILGELNSLYLSIPYLLNIVVIYLILSLKVLVGFR